MESQPVFSDHVITRADACVCLYVCASGRLCFPDGSEEPGAAKHAPPLAFGSTESGDYVCTTHGARKLRDRVAVVVFPDSTTYHTAVVHSSYSYCTWCCSVAPLKVLAHQCGAASSSEGPSADLGRLQGRHPPKAHAREKKAVDDSGPIRLSVLSARTHTNKYTCSTALPLPLSLLEPGCAAPHKSRAVRDSYEHMRGSGRPRTAAAHPEPSRGREHPCRTSPDSQPPRHTSVPRGSERGS